MFMHRIKLQNILSFGPDGQDLELKPLNILIGPNGSGKSNLIEVMGLLKAAPQDLAAAIHEGGGCDDWVWRGEPMPFISDVRVEAIVEYRARSYMEGQPIRYSMEFSQSAFGTPSIMEEVVEDAPSNQETEKGDFYLKRTIDKVTLSDRDEHNRIIQRDIPRTAIRSDQSILAQFKDPSRYPELTFRRRSWRSWIPLGILNSPFWEMNSVEYASIESGLLVETHHRDYRKRPTFQTTSLPKTERTLA